MSLKNIYIILRVIGVWFQYLPHYEIKWQHVPSKAFPVTEIIALSKEKSPLSINMKKNQTIKTKQK